MRGATLKHNKVKAGRATRVLFLRMNLVNVLIKKIRTSMGGIPHLLTSFN